MSLEVAIQNLADAINALAATRIPTSIDLTQSGNLTTQQAEAERYEAEQPKRGRGRPRKVEPTATPNEFPAEVAAPKAADVPQVTHSEPDPAVPTVVDAATLRHVLIEVVKTLGRDACGELCRKHGGPNLSALDPKVYPKVYAEALEMLGNAPAEQGAE